MRWLTQRVWFPLLALLRAGLTPAGLAWSVAAGMTVGTFPVLGSTTLLCVGVALAFRMNQPAMQVANYLAYPLQLALLVPFIRLGERLFGEVPLPLSLPALLQGLRADFWGSLATYGTRLGHACVAWSLVALPLMPLMAWVLRPGFEAAARRFRVAPGSPSVAPERAED